MISRRRVLENRYIRRYISSIQSFVQRAWHREIDGERSPGPGSSNPYKQTNDEQTHLARGAFFPALPLSFFVSAFSFFLFYKRWRACKESRTYFSRWFAGFVALSPRTTVRSAFLIAAGLLALKSDATTSLFRPALGADLGVDAGATGVAAGPAGFALKCALIVCD